MKIVWKFPTALILVSAVSLSGCNDTTTPTEIGSNALMGAEAEAAAESDRPNIILFMAEDLSPKLPIYGDPLAHTPNIEALATDGLVFDNAFTTSGVCAPSHASIITGMHSTAIGTHHMRQAPSVIPNPGIPAYNAVPPGDVKAFPEYLRQAGYWTSTYTKTDYQFGQPFTIWDEVTVSPHWRHRSDPQQPFFVYFTFEITHEINVWPDWRKQEFFEEHNVNVANLKPDVLIRPPLDEKFHTDPADVVVPPYYPDTPTVREDIARHYTSVSRMDRQIGQLMDDLEADGLLDSTIILFMADHGDGLPRAKRWMYDSGIKVPLVIHVPEKFRSKTQQYVGRTDRLVSGVDLAPTILELANVEVPDNLHGINIFDETTEHPYIYAGRDRMDNRYDMIRAVRDKRFKYIKNFDPEVHYTQPLTFMYQMPMMREILAMNEKNELTEVQSYWLFNSKPEEELYDTLTDPYEINNLAGQEEYQGQLLKMRVELERWREDVGDMGEVPEVEMAESMWPNGIQPLTEAPTISLDRDSATFELAATTKGASLAYRFDDSERWEIYREPTRVPANANVLRAKAVRYGYKESPEVTREIGR